MQAVSLLMDKLNSGNIPINQEMITRSSQEGSTTVHRTVHGTQGGQVDAVGLIEINSKTKTWYPPELNISHSFFSIPSIFKPCCEIISYLFHCYSVSYIRDWGLEKCAIYRIEY